MNLCNNKKLTNDFEKIIFKTTVQLFASCVKFSRVHHFFRESDDQQEMVDLGLTLQYSLKD